MLRIADGSSGSGSSVVVIKASGFGGASIFVSEFFFFGVAVRDVFGG